MDAKIVVNAEVLSPSFIPDNLIFLDEADRVRDADLFYHLI